MLRTKRPSEVMRCFAASPAGPGLRALVHRDEVVDHEETHRERRHRGLGAQGDTAEDQPAAKLSSRSSHAAAARPRKLRERSATEGDRLEAEARARVDPASLDGYDAARIPG
jgi:hypothetical protein